MQIGLTDFAKSINDLHNVLTRLKADLPYMTVNGGEYFLGQAQVGLSLQGRFIEGSAKQHLISGGREQLLDLGLVAQKLPQRRRTVRALFATYVVVYDFVVVD